jgi:hypothetical protein
MNSGRPDYVFEPLEFPDDEGAMCYAVISLVLWHRPQQGYSAAQVSGIQVSPHGQAYDT